MLRSEAIQTLTGTLVVRKLAQKADELFGKDARNDQRLFDRSTTGVHCLVRNEVGTRVICFGEPVAFGLGKPGVTAPDCREPDGLDVAATDCEQYCPGTERTGVVVDELWDHP